MNRLERFSKPRAKITDSDIRDLERQQILPKDQFQFSSNLIRVYTHHTDVDQKDDVMNENVVLARLSEQDRMYLLDLHEAGRYNREIMTVWLKRWKSNHSHNNPIKDADIALAESTIKTTYNLFVQRIKDVAITSRNTRDNFILGAGMKQEDPYQEPVAQSPASRVWDSLRMKKDKRGDSFED